MLHKKIIDSPTDCAHRLILPGYESLCKHESGPIKCVNSWVFPKHCPLQDFTLKVMRKSRINCYYIRYFKDCRCRTVPTLHCTGTSCGHFVLKSNPYAKIN